MNILVRWHSANEQIMIKLAESYLESKFGRYVNKKALHWLWLARRAYRWWRVELQRTFDLFGATEDEIKFYDFTTHDKR